MVALESHQVPSSSEEPFLIAKDMGLCPFVSSLIYSELTEQCLTREVWNLPSPGFLMGMVAWDCFCILPKPRWDAPFSSEQKDLNMMKPHMKQKHPLARLACWPLA